MECEDCGAICLNKYINCLCNQSEINIIEKKNLISSSSSNDNIIFPNFIAQFENLIYRFEFIHNIFLKYNIKNQKKNINITDKNIYNDFICDIV